MCGCAILFGCCGVRASMCHSAKLSRDLVRRVGDSCRVVFGAAFFRGCKYLRHQSAHLVAKFNGNKVCKYLQHQSARSVCKLNGKHRLQVLAEWSSVFVAWSIMALLRVLASQSSRSSQSVQSIVQVLAASIKLQLLQPMPALQPNNSHTTRR